MKGFYIIVISLLLINQVTAQEKYLTKEGYISFFSHSIVEDIKADNNQVLSVVDTSSGEIAIQLLMRSFMFKKALMQEHFNENYVESYKYPKASFTGHILNFEDLDELNGITEITGTLTVHGREKEISTKVLVEMKNNELILSGNFKVDVADFDIKIPAIVENNIAKTIKVSFELRHNPYN
ncbi:YceI family protein [uncultured Eudoraea sp.]|uniref:YceI family protein n=1 Tax=uncultured Eudoraea sp. TaxID=1035614 RepID=UPI00261368D6|nr:YceI family protein [uncultured Eudoraea sp.]